MRYYDIRLLQGNQVVRSWTSHPNGKYDPHALDVEFDMPISPGHLPNGAQTISIYGVALQDLVQAQQFTGMTLEIRGGMQAGLPLANPKQAGLLVAGEVFQSFGNWEGTDMTLDFVVVGSPFTLKSPGPIVLNWVAGMTLTQALTQCFAVAYPGIPASIHIAPDIVQNHDEKAMYATFDQLASAVEQLTRLRFQQPVYMVNLGGEISVFDLNYRPTPIQFAFTDFVGQPTWIKTNEMQVKTVLRGDIQPGSLIKMPKGLQDNPGIILTAAAAFPSQIRYKSTFSGNFLVQQVRHIGRFRTPDGAAWVTVANCNALQLS